MSLTQRRAPLIVGAVVVIAALAVAALSALHTAAPASSQASNDPTALSSVQRESLSSQTQASATLGYAGSYTVVSQASGTLTQLPSVGAQIAQGGVLYRVDGSPVVLLYGSVPVYRELGEGSEGADVRQLNNDLFALGYAYRTDRSDYFGYSTRYALERLQGHLGVTQTGTLALGTAVFLPWRVRIVSVNGSLGAPAPPGSPLLTATSTQRAVSLALDAAEQSEVAVGDRVQITLPDGSITPGRVSSVGSVATAPQGGGTPTINVTVTPSDPRATGQIDQAPVDVAITTATVKHALVVPVDALLALAGGGYGVEEAGSDGRHTLVAVALGLFDDEDGLVQVSGSALAAGQSVVVPSL